MGEKLLEEKEENAQDYKKISQIKDRPDPEIQKIRYITKIEAIEEVPQGTTHNEEKGQSLEEGIAVKKEGKREEQKDQDGTNTKEECLIWKDTKNTPSILGMGEIKKPRDHGYTLVEIQGGPDKVFGELIQKEE